MALIVRILVNYWNCLEIGIYYLFKSLLRFKLLLKLLLLNFTISSSLFFDLFLLLFLDLLFILFMKNYWIRGTLVEKIWSKFRNYLTFFLCIKFAFPKKGLQIFKSFEISWLSIKRFFELLNQLNDDWVYLAVSFNEHLFHCFICSFCWLFKIFLCLTKLIFILKH